MESCRRLDPNATFHPRACSTRLAAQKDIAWNTSGGTPRTNRDDQAVTESSMAEWKGR